MSKMVNLYEAKTHLSKLVEEVAAGAEVVIAKGGVAKARLVPIEAKARARKPALFKGRIRIRRDFDAPLPADILVAFGGGEDAS